MLQSPVCPPCIIKIFMGHALDEYGACTGRAQGVHGVCMGSAGGVQGACMGRARGMHRACTGLAMSPHKFADVIFETNRLSISY